MKKYILLLLLPILAYANIGKINVLKGDVTVTRDGEITKAHMGTTLEKNDFIETKSNAKVQIIFKDNTIFTIGKNSTLDIADYLYDEAKPTINKAKFNVLKGAFTSITGRIGKLNKSKFKLKTKSASIGIRGTIVKADQQTIMVTEGAITVTTKNGVSVNMDAGTKTSVASGTPTKPKAIESGDEAKMGADVTEEDKKASKEQAKQEKTTANKSTTQKQEKEQEKSTTENTTTSEKTTESTTTTTTTTTTKSNVDNELDKANSGTLSPQTGSTMKDGIVNDDFTVTVDTENKTATTDSGDSLNVKSADSSVSWGYWNDGSGGIDNKKVWVSGQETSIGVLNSNNSPATYTGQSIGNVEMADGSDEKILVNSDNAINLNFDLGGGAGNVNGNIKFKTSNSSWNANLQGSASGSGFTSTVSDNGLGDVGIITEGSQLSGKFYGDDADAVGGTFNINSAETHKATGVFKATK